MGVAVAAGGVVGAPVGVGAGVWASEAGAVAAGLVAAAVAVGEAVGTGEAVAWQAATAIATRKQTHTSAARRAMAATLARRASDAKCRVAGRGTRGTGRATIGPSPVTPGKEVTVTELISRASATWEGDLLGGAGRVSTETSPAFRDLPVSWSSRTEAHAGRTSPEELLAAAHAACFSMALSNTLAKDGTPPTRLDTTATVAFARGDTGWGIASSHLAVRGRVPGATAAGFADAAERAKDGCPVSRALVGNVALSVEATLVDQ